MKFEFTTRLTKHAIDPPLAILKISPNLSYSQMLKMKSLDLFSWIFWKIWPVFVYFDGFSKHKKIMKNDQNWQNLPKYPTKQVQ